MKRKSYTKPKLRMNVKEREAAVAIIRDLTLARHGLREGLRDLLAYYDRREQSGWTSADVKRLAEIRKLVL